jgi:hypothetical protein
MISFVKRKKTLPARSEEREERKLRQCLGGFMPLGKVPAIRRTIHPFAASSNGEPRLSQKIEFVFSASPETSEREPGSFRSSAQT